MPIGYLSAQSSFLCNFGRSLAICFDLPPLASQSTPGTSSPPVGVSPAPNRRPACRALGLAGVLHYAVKFQSGPRPRLFNCVNGPPFGLKGAARLKADYQRKEFVWNACQSLLMRLSPYVLEAAAWRMRGAPGLIKKKNHLWLWKMKTGNLIQFKLQLPAGNTCRMLMRR